MALLDEILAKLDALPPEAVAALEAKRRASRLLFVPNPGGQTMLLKSKADEIFFGGEPGGGKALDLATPIPTPSGWTTMGRLRVGSIVYDERGRTTRVVAMSEVMIGRDCYRVEFDDGHAVVADGNHLWVTKTARDRAKELKFTEEWRAARRASRPSRAGGGVRLRPDVARKNREKQHVYSEPPQPQTRTTLEIASTLMHNGKERNHSVELCPSIECAPRNLPIPPYTLGAWLGDGSSSAPSITSMDPEILSEIGKDGFVLEVAEASSNGNGKAKTYRIRRMGQQVQHGDRGHVFSPMSFQVDLKVAGVFGNKHVPPAYLRASREDRLLFLAGLMDTDGSADGRGKCEFTSTNRDLADGVAELLVSLGTKAVVTEGRAMLRGRDCGPKYRVIFTPDFQVFRLPRKADRLRLDRTARKTQKRRYICAVTKVPSVPVRCIQVEAASGQFLCGRGMIPTHNSHVLIGAAVTEHSNSIIFRREFSQIKGLEDAAEDILKTRDGYNASTHVWRIPQSDRTLEFGSVPHEKDKKRYQGRAHDLKGFDEICHFTRSQYLYLTLWLRSADPTQRTRIIATGNPPDSPEGLWVIEHWAPWLDPTYHDPAKPGELRWAVPMEEGSEKEIFFRSIEDAKTHVLKFKKPPVDHNGKFLPPRSRTFIPGKLQENPDYVRTGYQATLAYATGALAGIAAGDFESGLKDDPWQVIPTAWILAAQKRWTNRPPQGVPMVAIGVDVAQGGSAETVLAPRHDYWFAPLVAVPGSDTPNPSDVASLVVKHRRDMAAVVVDCDGGWGGGVVEFLGHNNIAALKYKGSTSGHGRTKDRAHGFQNKRAEAWWRFREALDPEQAGGSPIAIPDDPAIRADLAAPRYSITPRGILVEPKVDIIKRIGRSPDKGDAVVMSWTSGNEAIRKGMVGAGASVGAQQDRPAFANVGYASSKRRR